jgi:hypothetical protein
MYAVKAQLYISTPLREEAIVGIATETTVESTAARNMPIRSPAINTFERPPPSNPSQTPGCLIYGYYFFKLSALDHSSFRSKSRTAVLIKALLLG